MDENKKEDKINNSEELVFGLVGPTGSDLNRLALEIKNSIKRFNYESTIFLATDFFQITHHDEYKEVKDGNEYNRISKFMDWGDELRKKSESYDIFTRHFVSKIKKERNLIPRQAFILKSLKHPEEVNTLRYIYNDSFYLVGLWSDEDARKRFLRGHKKINSNKDIKDLIERDKSAAVDYGQQQVKTFHLADVFIQFSPIEAFRSQIDRFLNLLFGHPFVTPNWEEHCMFLSYAASLRSADLSRQVGAVIVSKKGDVISQGCNEVPKSGGGQYKNNDKPDVRDFQKGYDSNAVIKDKITQCIFSKIINHPDVRDLFKSDEPKNAIRNILKESSIKDITEFSRALHAEMDCLLAASRSGRSVVGGTMYVTTFPCHNCAKHIIASGLKKVIYIEPYPKSRALELHDDSISLNAEKTKHVQFLPFIGLGPRKYFDLFSTQMSTGYKINRKDSDDSKITHFEALLENKEFPKPRLCSVISSYEEKEKEMIAQLDEFINKYTNKENNQ